MASICCFHEANCAMHYGQGMMAAERAAGGDVGSLKGHVFDRDYPVCSVNLWVILIPLALMGR